MYTINLTKEQFEYLQNNKTLTINLDEPKQEKWIPSGDEFRISDDFLVSQTGLLMDKVKLAGMMYETESEAIKASKALRAYARQLKWLSENSDGWTANWSDTDQEKYYVYCHAGPKKYHFASNKSNKTINTIYMSEENAEKLCRLLNEGVVEF